MKFFTLRCPRCQLSSSMPVPAGDKVTCPECQASIILRRKKTDPPSEERSASSTTSHKSPAAGSIPAKASVGDEKQLNPKPNSKPNSGQNQNSNQSHQALRETQHSKTARSGSRIRLFNYLSSPRLLGISVTSLGILILTIWVIAQNQSPTDQQATGQQAALRNGNATESAPSQDVMSHPSESETKSPNPTPNVTLGELNDSEEISEKTLATTTLALGSPSLTNAPASIQANHPISESETESYNSQEFETDRSDADMAVDQQGFAEVITPFMQTYCVSCHGGESPDGGLQLESPRLKNQFTTLASRQIWGEVVNVLNSHSMPPESETQPTTEEVAQVVDWITQQMIQAEAFRKESAIVLRRLNRNEYRNTIRDLLGVDVDISAFLEDPAAGGFDNNGSALTLSPLHLETYYNAARDALDEAIVEGDQPAVLRWRFQPESGQTDSNRVMYDGQNLIVNGGEANRVEGEFLVMHSSAWNRVINVRGFTLPTEGLYRIRIHAAGVTPSRDQVVNYSRGVLQKRFDDEMKANPSASFWHQRSFDQDLKHFQTDRMYDYGPPRLQVIQDLGGHPLVLGEREITAPVSSPETIELSARFRPEDAGINIHYAYSVPGVLENFWFQNRDDFPRPELWVDWIEIEGPIYSEWPPTSHRQLIGETPASREDEISAARRILSRFMERAYRRPVNDSEVDSKLRLFELVRDDSESFLAAIKSPLSAVLISPHFLYLTEVNKDYKAPEPSNSSENAFKTLTDYELASRLSYFLWSSMPDETLFEIAKSGRLHDRDVLIDQVRRMLADPKSEALVENFTDQWLGLREVGLNPPVQELFPHYDRHLETSIIEESRAFFREILRHDLNIQNFLKSDFVVINERLARAYGIPDVRGDDFRRVMIPEEFHRGGIVTQASILAITSNGTRTSPVKRGVWILKNVLGIDPGQPVANAGEIAPSVPGIDKATVRDRLEIHRSLPQCARCHDKIDPLGFALENFNAAGEWRAQEGFGYNGRINEEDPMINASASMPDGSKIVGVQGLQAALLQQKSQFLKTLTRKLMTYSLGRELHIADSHEVNLAVESLSQEGETLSSLIEQIVMTPQFQQK